MMPKSNFLQKYSLILVVYSLVFVLITVGSIYSERFLTLRNLTNVLRQAAYLGTAALGEMLVILNSSRTIFVDVHQTNEIQWFRICFA